MASGIALDTGHNFQVYAFVLSFWTYPVVLLMALALVLARKQPRFVVLPLLSALVFFITGVIPR
jgi:hypothetical protein